MLASLAGRVERQLLRALRLNLAPHLAAADEADVWFSPYIQTAGETGLLFRPAALPELQRRLAQDPLGRLELAWRLIFQLRTGVTFAERGALKHSTWLLVQEELTYWGLRGGPSNDEDERRIATLCAWGRQQPQRREAGPRRQRLVAIGASAPAGGVLEPAGRARDARGRPQPRTAAQALRAPRRRGRRAERAAVGGRPRHRHLRAAGAVARRDCPARRERRAADHGVGRPGRVARRGDGGASGSQPRRRAELRARNRAGCRARRH